MIVILQLQRNFFGNAQDWVARVRLGVYTTPHNLVESSWQQKSELSLAFSPHPRQGVINLDVEFALTNSANDRHRLTNDADRIYRAQPAHVDHTYSIA